MDKGIFDDDDAGDDDDDDDDDAGDDDEDQHVSKSLGIPLIWLLRHHASSS